MKLTYCALACEDKPKGFSVMFPDFDGCVTQGDTIDEVKLMAEDVLSLRVSFMNERHEKLPEPTTDYKKLLAMADPDWTPVSFIIPITIYTASPVVRISMTGPEDKLEMIKEFANSCGTNRSAFMIEASMEKIARMKRGE